MLISIIGPTIKIKGSGQDVVLLILLMPIDSGVIFELVGIGMAASGSV